MLRLLGSIALCAAILSGCGGGEVPASEANTSPPEPRQTQPLMPPTQAQAPTQS